MSFVFYNFIPSEIKEAGRACLSRISVNCLAEMPCCTVRLKTRGLQTRSATLDYLVAKGIVPVPMDDFAIASGARLLSR